MNNVLGDYRPTAGPELTDGQLLDSFVAHREESAFENLVRRHGPMVLGVCRRLLGNAHDAEDAFQATFLVLIRKAASVSPRERVGAWLYGVASHSLKARALAAKRRAKEQIVPRPAVTEDPALRELLALLDQEVSRLPAKYRVPLVLCDLGGKSRREAAQQLGWPEGTLSVRVARAKALLAQRLARRGLALSGAVLFPEVASACLPTTLVNATLQAAAGVVSAPVALLTEGVLHAMLMTRVKAIALFLLAAGVVGTGAGTLAYRAWAAQPPAGTSVNTPAQAAAKAASDLDKLQGTWALASEERGGNKEEPPAAAAKLVVKAVKVTLMMGGQMQEGTLKLDDTKTPKEIDLTVTEGGQEATRLGIYKLDGDTLTLCKSHPPDARPAEFSTQAGAKWPAIFVFKKQKAEVAK